MTAAPPAPVNPPSTLGRLARRISREGALLTLIVLAAGALRIYKLEEVPPGVYCDEVALGVNAKFLGTTGASLKGKSLPLYVHEASFEQYGSKKIVYQPIYQYTVVPFVELMGLSATSVRLPSVLFGLAGILAAHLLARTLFGVSVGLWTAALLAVSPWHHQFSRIGFEVTSLTPLLALGTWLLWRGLERPRLLTAGAAVLGLATYAYPAARLFVPLLALGFAIVHWRELRINWRPAMNAAAVAALVGLPNLYLLLTDPNQGRMNYLFIFNAETRNEAAVRALESSVFENWWAVLILDHPVLRIPFVFLYNYFSHLSPAFLFHSGDANARHALQGLGMEHVFSAPLLAAGLVALFRRRAEAASRLVLWWFLTWPIPASLTIDCPHATRGFTNFPSIEITMALGLQFLFRHAADVVRFRGPVRLKSAVAGCALWFAILRSPHDLVGFLLHYHKDYPVYSAEAWDAGVGPAFRLARRVALDGEPITVSYGIHNAWLNTLFFTNADPRTLAPPARTGEPPLPHGYHVSRLARSGARRAGLWIIKAEEERELPEARVVARIPYPDGDPNLLIVRVERP